MSEIRPSPLLSRRQWLLAAGASILAPGCSRNTPAPAPPAVVPPADAGRFPGKGEMIVRTERPVCLETPWQHFENDITPNHAFYVRWHAQALPAAIEESAFRLRVAGHVERPVEFTLDELRRLEQVTVVAVNQCAGNSRSFFAPNVPGVVWANGAMGNARWKGARLRQVLQQAGLRAGAVEVAFSGRDRSLHAPEYVKSLTVDEARQVDVLLAYEMNGEPLPLLHGQPLRLIVPGWYATYWMKSIDRLDVLDVPFTGDWMRSHYRIPNNASAAEKPDQLAGITVPVKRMRVRSFLTSHSSGSRVGLNQPVTLSGIAFDGGDGIRFVEVSTDGGVTWARAEPGEDLGRYSFRRWRHAWTPRQAGAQRVLVRATSNSGETQPTSAVWNRSGYVRNVIEETRLEVA